MPLDSTTRWQDINDFIANVKKKASPEQLRAQLAVLTSGEHPLTDKEIFFLLASYVLTMHETADTLFGVADIIAALPKPIDFYDIPEYREAFCEEYFTAYEYQQSYGSEELPISVAVGGAGALCTLAFSTYPFANRDQQALYPAMPLLKLAWRGKKCQEIILTLIAHGLSATNLPFEDIKTYLNHNDNPVLKFKYAQLKKEEYWLLSGLLNIFKSIKTLSEAEAVRIYNNWSQEFDGIYNKANGKDLLQTLIQKMFKVLRLRNEQAAKQNAPLNLSEAVNWSTIDPSPDPAVVLFLMFRVYSSSLPGQEEKTEQLSKSIHSELSKMRWKYISQDNFLFYLYHALLKSCRPQDELAREREMVRMGYVPEETDAEYQARIRGEQILANYEVAFFAFLRKKPFQPETRAETGPASNPFRPS